MTEEDEEFERIEREAKIRNKHKEPSPIPLITDEEWEALNKEENATE
jgi:hypothetical protein